VKYIAAEFRKIFTLRFLLILLAAVAVNFLLLWHNQSNSNAMYRWEDYTAAQHELLEMEEGKRLEYLQEQQRMLFACQAWKDYDYKVQSGMDVSNAITPEMEEFRETYENGTYLRFCSDILSERYLIQDLLADVLQVTNYHEKLETVIAEAKLKTSVSIFAKPGTFAYRNLLQVIERFEALRPVQPVYDVSKGVLNAVHSKTTDLIAVVMVLFFCTTMVVMEYKNGMLQILRATKNGRLQLILAKAATTFILSLLISCVLWFANLAYCAGSSGLGDLSRPVQSLKGFSSCAVDISVGEYIFGVLTVKWLLYATVGIVCLIVGLYSQNAVFTWLLVGAFLSVEYVIAQALLPVSALNILKYLNISNMLFSEEWISQYRNLDFFGFPVSVVTACCVLAAALPAAGVLWLCQLFCGKKVRFLPSIKLNLAWPNWLPRPGRSTVLFAHEMWKLMIECGTLLVLVLFVTANMQKPAAVSYGTEELYIKNYMEMLQGPVTEETDAFLAAEIQRFENIRSQLQQLRKECSEGKITTSDLQMLSAPLERALVAERVLRTSVIPKVERAKAMAASGQEAWLLYDRGYQYLFGVGGRHDKTGAATLLLAGIILCFANFYPLETTSGMQPILNVYARGRSATAWTKIAIATVVTTVLFLVAQIPDYRYVIRNYGLPMLSAPICSLEAFAGWSSSFSILGTILIYEGLRLLTSLTAAMIVLLFCLLVRNQVIALCGCTGILLLPFLMHLLELKQLDKVSLYLPMTGSELFWGKEPLPLCVLYYGMAALIGCICVWQIIRITKMEIKSKGVKECC